MIEERTNVHIPQGAYTHTRLRAVKQSNDIIHRRRCRRHRCRHRHQWITKRTFIIDIVEIETFGEHFISYFCYVVEQLVSYF